MELIPDFSIIIFEFRGEQLALVWVFFWGEECGVGYLGGGSRKGYVFAQSLSSCV